MPISPPIPVQRLSPDGTVDADMSDSEFIYSDSDMDLGSDTETDNIPLINPDPNPTEQKRLEQQRVIEQMLADLCAR